MKEDQASPGEPSMLLGEMSKRLCAASRLVRRVAVALIRRIRGPAGIMHVGLALVLITSSAAPAEILHRLPSGSHLRFVSAICGSPGSAAAKNGAAPRKDCILVTRARVLELLGHRRIQVDRKHGAVIYLVRVLEHGRHVGVIGWVGRRDIFAANTGRPAC